MPILTWIGKEKIVNHHQEVPYKVLDHAYTYDKSGLHKNDFISENKIIHGDNLEALKSLMPQYEGKINCIYIDPPYNTGNENWVYNDNVNDPRLVEWLGTVVGKDDDLSKHDKWLCMIYPRLKLLHKLLATEGAIFISIDDNELFNLKSICDEIFGSQNFISNIIWKRKRGRDNSAKWFSKAHEYLLVYSKNKASFKVNKLELDESTKKAYKNPDNDMRGDYRKLGCWARGNQSGVEYDFTSKDGQYFSKRMWLFSKENMQKMDIEDKLIFYKDNIYRKMFLYENNGKIPETLWDDVSNAANASDEIKKLFDKIIFNTSKPLPYIKQILQIATNKDSIILDSFAGSGTTGHAVMDLNRQDGGNRKYIMIEMEDYAESITAERMKKVIMGYGEGKKAVSGIDDSFSYYELGKPILINGNLNEELDIEQIKSYIYFMETKQYTVSTHEPYYLGTHLYTGYYLYYEKGSITTLDYTFLGKITKTEENYVIYADRCLLTEEELSNYHITFKKIPRDISKL